MLLFSFLFSFFYSVLRKVTLLTKVMSSILIVLKIKTNNNYHNSIIIIINKTKKYYLNKIFKGMFSSSSFHLEITNTNLIESFQKLNKTHIQKR